MPFLRVLHKIITQSRNALPYSLKEVDTILGFKICYIERVGWRGKQAARRTLQCTQPTRPKVLLLLPTRWFYPLSLTSTLISVECKIKQTKLSKAPPTPSGLRGGRHKALYTVHQYQRDKANDSEFYQTRKIYFEPPLVFSWSLLVLGQRYLLRIALRGKRPAKSTRAGLHLGKLEELALDLPSPSPIILNQQVTPSYQDAEDVLRKKQVFQR